MHGPVMTVTKVYYDASNYSHLKSKGKTKKEKGRNYDDPRTFHLVLGV